MEEEIKTDEVETTKENVEEAGTVEEQEIVKQAKDAATIAKEAEEIKATNLKAEEKLMDRKEALNALGGRSDAGGIDKKPEVLTDTQYAEALERGEVNPLKEDGII